MDWSKVQDPDRKLQIEDFDNDGADAQKSWEGELDRTWDAVPVGRGGELQTALFSDRQRRKRMRVGAHAGGLVKKGMVRYLQLVLDFSDAMNERDLKPTRKLCVTDFACAFIEQFFDQNPISQLGVIVCARRTALCVTELSGNPKQQVERLRKESARHKAHGGDFSLQNGLKAALVALQHIPPYGSREIILVHGSLTTVDPGDVTQTISELKTSRVRASVISLVAKPRICSVLAAETKGRHDVCLSRANFKELLTGHVQPYAIKESDKFRRRWIRMGFPLKQRLNFPSLCQCHREFKYNGFKCPKCHTMSCELPSNCGVCGLSLISSAQLARCYYHLFPVSPFEEVKSAGQDDDVSSGTVIRSTCFACQTSLDSSQRVVVRCPKCRQTFCVDCDVFIHESLHNCPGCLSCR